MPQAVAMSACPMPPVTPVTDKFRAADMQERTHQAGYRAKQAQQRRERDQRIHHHEKAPRAFCVSTPAANCNAPSSEPCE